MSTFACKKPSLPSPFNSPFPPFPQLAKFLTEHYEDEVREEHLLLTPGASIGLWMAGMKFLEAGRGVVFMEAPSYFIASQGSGDPVSTEYFLLDSLGTYIRTVQYKFFIKFLTS